MNVLFALIGFIVGFIIIGDAVVPFVTNILPGFSALIIKLVTGGALAFLGLSFFGKGRRKGYIYISKGNHHDDVLEAVIKVLERRGFSLRQVQDKDGVEIYIN